MLLALCLLHQLGWDASALFYSPFGVLSLDLEHSSAMFACHIPTRLGTAMQQIQQSLVIGFDPNHRGEKETAL